jgi:flagellar biosynthesis/type III secretory pathway chaperone
MPPDRIAPAADALLDTLEAQANVLSDLDDLYERQLHALKTSDPDALGALAMQTQDRAAALEDLHRKSERQAAARTAVAEQVQAVHERRETLRLALEYAAGLNHDLLAAMQNAAGPDDGHTYTAAGQPASAQSPDNRSFVNTLG